MGLDMYLYKKHYVKNNEWSSEKFEVSVKRNGKPYKGINYDRVTCIEEKVGYWRKFNALHAWFVELSGREDDCAPIYVSKESLERLIETLQKVLSVLDNANVKTLTDVYSDGSNYSYKVYDCAEEIEELLPPTGGFFFGNTDINDHYYRECKDTLVLLTTELSNSDNAEFYYQASW